MEWIAAEFGALGGMIISRICPTRASAARTDSEARNSFSCLGRKSRNGWRRRTARTGLWRRK
jgi:hypothetical protein